jgi:chemotaxis protein MotB
MTSAGRRSRADCEGGNEMIDVTWARRGLLSVMLLPLVAGCMTSKAHENAMAEKDDQIRQLHDERTELKNQVQSLKTQLDTANGELTNASARMSEPSAATETHASAKDNEKIPELDDVGVTYGMRGGNMVISIPSAITFPSGEATLSKDGQKALEKVGATLKKKYPGAIYSIEGNTDTDPIKKSKFTSNRDLSIARARAVHTYLVVDCGVPDSKCVVVGHGEYDPVAANDNEKDKAKNRRVEIVVHNH